MHQAARSVATLRLRTEILEGFLHALQPSSLSFASVLML